MFVIFFRKPDLAGGGFVVGQEIVATCLQDEVEEIPHVFDVIDGKIRFSGEVDHFREKQIGGLTGAHAGFRIRNEVAQDF